MVQITNAGDGVEKRESSYTVGENVNWCSHYVKQYGSSLIEMPNDSALPPFGIHSEKILY